MMNIINFLLLLILIIIISGAFITYFTTRKEAKNTNLPISCIGCSKALLCTQVEATDLKACDKKLERE